jgi:glycosyltransferase involved in cell wall biosynthesis
MIKDKVLFISHDPFSEIGSNGKTYLSLFSEFEDGEIGQLYFNNLEPSSGIFNNFFRITDIDIIKYLFSFSTKGFTGKVEKAHVKNINARVVKRSVLRTDLIKLLRNFLFSIVKTSKIKAFKEWMNNLKPTVIFFVGSNYGFAYQVLYLVSQKYNIPYYIYFTDDYFKYNNGTNVFTNLLHKRFVERSKKIVEGAEELFVISPKMREEYEQYFGKKCTVLINAVDKGELHVAKSQLEKPIIFRYFGWLHSNRSSSLRHLGECLKYINEHYPQKCILEVYTLTIPIGKTQTDLDIDTIQVYDPLLGDALKNKIITSDFLVHAESFEPEDTQVTMLSISTKIPEYFLSNRCVVAVGPDKLASISIFKENDLGIVLSDKTSIKADADEIYNVINDMALYNDYCMKAQAFYDKEFDAPTMRLALKSKLLKNQLQKINMTE